MVDTAGLTETATSNLDLVSFVLQNLIPVTAGNLVGGVILVGAVYWIVYLRKKTAPPST